MDRIYIDRDWKFCDTWSEDMTKRDYDDHAMESVIVPHNVKEIPLNYFDENDYQMVSCYRRHFTADPSWKDRAVLLTFDGIAHEATVYVNGEMAAVHTCGYTAFTTDISTYLRFGEDNVISVKVDSRESLDQPPFGFVIDYLTYGGIYRDVYIDVRSRSHVSRTSIRTKLTDRYDNDGHLFCKKGAVITKVYISGALKGQKLISYIRKKGDTSYEKLAESEVIEGYTETCVRMDDVELWDVDNPALYEQKTELVDAFGAVLDEHTDTFGFRKAVFRNNGFFLNGRKLKIRGLNRHQSFAYCGYAMPDSMQQLDAVILKDELGVNAVRTSHYPQAQSFIDKCDEIGLLVFTEIPGWQHIGGSEWKDKAVENVKDMIRQYINHPSIILWGVRINESVDDEEFYARTNALAHAEDPDRQTGGVRCYKKGTFQEDVYTYNDFSHCGDNAGVEKKSSVSPDTSKPYMVTEYNGHMFPTKAFDPEDHRLDHMLRHSRVLNDVAADPDICGSFGWCMFDYNTHKDFGSGDRICYHGVCDIFRNPKDAAYVYSAQQDDVPVLHLSSAMNIGEHPGGNIGRVYIITNADVVRMYKNNELIKEYAGSSSEFGALLHGPIRIDDYVGDALSVHEGMSGKKAKDIKSLLNALSEKGLYRIPLPLMAKAGMLMARYRLSYSDIAGLYGKYVANWGEKVSTYRFEAVKNGEVVKELVVEPFSKMNIKLIPSTDKLCEDRTYDVALVRLRAEDQNGNVLSFCNDPLSFKTEGPIEIIGPKMSALSGGMGGVYVRSAGCGQAALIVTDGRGTSHRVEFTVSGKGNE